MKKIYDGLKSFLRQLGAHQVHVLLVSTLAAFAFVSSVFMREKSLRVNDLTQLQSHFYLLEHFIQEISSLKGKMKYQLSNLLEKYFYSYLGPKDNYVFPEVYRPFGQVSLYRSCEITGEEFEKLILQSVPDLYKDKLSLYIRKTMYLATEYQVDPFWILSIMWVESQFENYARSPMDARGLMQIMPDTGKFIAQKLNMGHSDDGVYDLIWSPHINIEMGVYYLRYLLDYFDNDYFLATMAYNYGPSKVKQLLLEQDETISTNLYYKKVKRAYRYLTKEYIKTLEGAVRPVLLTMDKKSNMK